MNSAQAWSPMKSRSLCIRGAVEWLVTIGGSHFQSMSPQLKSPLITMFGWDFFVDIEHFQHGLRERVNSR